MCSHLAITTSGEGVRFVVDGTDILDIEQPTHRTDGSPRPSPLEFRPAYIDRVLPPESSVLLPASQLERSLVGVCSCGEAGCASLWMSVRRDGDEMVWGPDPDPPGHSVTHTWRFPILTYLGCIDDAVNALSDWQSPADRLARKIRMSLRNDVFPPGINAPFELGKVHAYPAETITFTTFRRGQELEQYKVPVIADDTVESVFQKFTAQLQPQIDEYRRRRPRRITTSWQDRGPTDSS